MESKEKEKLKKIIIKVYKGALNFDNWGQNIEAIKEYRIVKKKIQFLDFLEPEEIVIFSNLEIFVQTRIDNLNMKENCLRIDKSDMQSILKILVRVILKKSKKKINYTENCLKIIQSREFHPTESKLISPVTRKNSNKDLFLIDSEKKLKAARVGKSGDTILSIFIEKIGLKDLEKRGYIEPFITVSVINEEGNNIESSQNTPFTNVIEEKKYIIFNNTVNIQTPINNLKKSTKFFFEFKHFKPKKNKISVRCWTLLELDDLKNGKVAFELYRKPTQFIPKKFRLLTIKKLFLHVELKLLKY